MRLIPISYRATTFAGATSLVLMLTACGSGNNAEIPDETTQAQGFLGSTNPAASESSSSPQPTEEPQSQSALPGIGGQVEQPLDDLPQPGLSPDSPDTSGDSLDLSGDILIPPPAPKLAITTQPGELVFSWDIDQLANAEDNPVFALEQYDRIERQTHVLVNNLDADTTGYRLPVIPHEFNWETTEFILSACTDSDCLKSLNTAVNDLQAGAVNRLQGTDGEDFDLFGSSMASAANGKILVVGRPGHDPELDETGTTVNGENPDTRAFDAGSAELFFEVAGQWWQGAELQVTAPDFNSQLGYAVAADSSGNTLVIGAPGNSQVSDLAGAAHVFIRTGETWMHATQLSPGLTREFSRFGHAVAISGDGTLIAVAAPGDSNSTTNPYAPEQTANNAGSVTLFRYDEASDKWLLSDYVRSPQRVADERFGQALALSEDASTLLVSAPGANASEERTMPGVVHVIDIESAGTFNRQSLFQTAENPQDRERSEFGAEIALSADGSTVVVTSLNRPLIDDNRGNALSKPQTQAVVYSRTQFSPARYETIDRLTPAGGHGFDSNLSVAISGDGSKIATGLLNPAPESSSVTVFQRSALQPDATVWNVRNSFGKPADSDVDFASQLEFSKDGQKLFISSESNEGGGAVYVY